MTARDMEARLTRIEGLLAMLVREHAELPDIAEAERQAYRRGYITGHHAMRAGRACDPDAALSARRKVRAA